VWVPAACLIALVVAPLVLQRSEMTKPLPPHKVIGNLYFVATANLGSYLVRTPEGHMLVNTDFEETVPTIGPRVENVGSKLGRNPRGNVDA
jgi:metallo-beta-lactamase class B